jgi:hypothetical protein
MECEAADLKPPSVSLLIDDGPTEGLSSDRPDSLVDRQS